MYTKQAQSRVVAGTGCMGKVPLEGTSMWLAGEAEGIRPQHTIQPLGWVWVWGLRSGWILDSPNRYLMCQHIYKYIDFLSDKGILATQKGDGVIFNGTLYRYEELMHMPPGLSLKDSCTKKLNGVIAFQSPCQTYFQHQLNVLGLWTLRPSTPSNMLKP